MSRLSPGVRSAVILAAAAVAVVVALRAGASPATPPAQARATPVRVAAVAPAPATRPVQLFGLTRSGDRAELAFEVSGRVSSRPVQIGDRVEAGAVLATLERDGYANAAYAAASRLAEIDARVAQLRRDRDRARRLVAGSAVAPVELEKVEAELAAAAAGRNAAKVQLREARRVRGEARLTAPFDGIVTEVWLEPGELARGGAPIVGLSGAGGVEIEVEVPGALIDRVEPGMAAEVGLPLLGRAGLEGRVRSVSRAARRAGRLFPVVVTVASAGELAPGMSAAVTLELPRPPALVVPVAAIVDPTGQRASLFVVDGTRSRRVPVEIGALAGDRIEVRGDDLEAGDTVVVAGHTELLDGDAIEVVK